MNQITDSTPPRRSYSQVAMDPDPRATIDRNDPDHKEWLNAFMTTQSSLDKIMVNVRRRS